MPPMSQRKGDYTKWLKATILAAVPQFPPKFLGKLRPHGWRAGWVSDRRKEGTPDNITMREGRWSSERAMGLYDRATFNTVCPVSTILFATTDDTARSRRRR